MGPSEAYFELTPWQVDASCPGVGPALLSMRALRRWIGPARIRKVVQGSSPARNGRPNFHPASSARQGRTQQPDATGWGVRVYAPTEPSPTAAASATTSFLQTTFAPPFFRFRNRATLGAAPCREEYGTSSRTGPPSLSTGQ